MRVGASGGGGGLMRRSGEHRARTHRALLCMALLAAAVLVVLRAEGRQLRSSLVSAVSLQFGGKAQQLPEDWKLPTDLGRDADDALNDIGDPLQGDAEEEGNADADAEETTGRDPLAKPEHNPKANPRKGEAKTGVTARGAVLLEEGAEGFVLLEPDDIPEDDLNTAGDSVLDGEALDRLQNRRREDKLLQQLTGESEAGGGAGGGAAEAAEEEDAEEADGEAEHMQETGFEDDAGELQPRGTDMTNSPPDQEGTAPGVAPGIAPAPATRFAAASPAVLASSPADAQQLQQRQFDSPGPAAGAPLQQQQQQQHQQQPARQQHLPQVAPAQAAQGPAPAAAMGPTWVPAASAPQPQQLGADALIAGAPIAAGAAAHQQPELQQPADQQPLLQLLAGQQHQPNIQAQQQQQPQATLPLAVLLAQHAPAAHGAAPRLAAEWTAQMPQVKKKRRRRRRQKGKPAPQLAPLDALLAASVAVAAAAAPQAGSRPAADALGIETEATAAARLPPVLALPSARAAAPVQGGVGVVRRKKKRKRRRKRRRGNAPAGAPASAAVVAQQGAVVTLQAPAAAPIAGEAAIPVQQSSISGSNVAQQSLLLTSSNVGGEQGAAMAPSDREASQMQPQTMPGFHQEHVAAAKQVPAAVQAAMVLQQA